MTRWQEANPLTLPKEHSVRDVLSVNRVALSHLHIGLNIDGRAEVSWVSRLISRAHPLPSLRSCSCWFSLKEKTLCHDVGPSMNSAVSGRFSLSLPPLHTTAPVRRIEVHSFLPRSVRPSYTRRRSRLRGLRSIQTRDGLIAQSESSLTPRRILRRGSTRRNSVAGISVCRC